MSEEISVIRSELKILSAMVVLVLAWMFIAPIEGYNILSIPLSIVSGLLLILVGMWFGLKIDVRRQKRRMRQQILSEKTLIKEEKQKEEHPPEEEYW